jgi:hypothetical protein
VPTYITLGTISGKPATAFQTHAKPRTAPERRWVSSWMKSTARYSARIETARAAAAEAGEPVRPLA